MVKYFDYETQHSEIVNQLNEHDTDTIERIFNKVIHERNLNKFKAQYGDLKKARGVNSIARLTDNPQNSVALNFDHADLWELDGEPYMFTFQPYMFSKEEFKALSNYCRNNGLTYHLHNFNFHYPAKCNMIVVKKNEIPIVYADEKQTQLSFKCKYCKEVHNHSKYEGHRVAHCTNKNSPYNDTGYILKIKK